jgi:hypothetical protein
VRACEYNIQPLQRPDLPLTDLLCARCSSVCVSMSVQKHLQAAVDILQGHLSKLDQRLERKLEGIEARLTKMETVMLGSQQHPKPEVELGQQAGP